MAIKPTYEELDQRIKELESHLEQMEETLRVSVERNRLATSAAKVGVWDWDIKTGDFYLDPNIKAILGYTDDEIPNDVEIWVKYVHPEDSKAVMEAAQACLDGKTAEYIFEHRMLHKDGSIRWILVRGKAIRDESGNAVRLIGTDADITDRKQVEEALRESEGRYRNIYDNALVGLFRSRLKDGNIVMANDRMAEMFGYENAEECVAKYVAIEHYVHQEMRDELLEIMREHGQVTNFETAIRKDDGSITWVQFSGILSSEEGCFEGVATDITELKKAEQELWRSEESYRAIVEDMPALVCRFLSDGTLSFVNSSYCRYFNKKREELVGENFFKFIPEQERERVSRHFQSLTQENSVVIYEHKVFAPDGEIRWQQWTDRALFNDQGKLTQYQSIGLDITERKKAETALREKEKKLAHQAENLKEVNTALKILLEHREEERRQSDEDIMINLKKLILPYIEKIEKTKLNEKNATYLGIIKSNLWELVSPFANKLSSKFFELTPSEIQIIDLIKHGKTSKEIASLLNVSPKAVSFHRGNIRKKLGLSNKKINLRSYLQSFLSADSP